MPQSHQVIDGECISSIADARGFFWNTLWDHPKNERLRALREDPNTLVPGDNVYIPDKRRKEEVRLTGALHRFQKLNAPAVFRLQLFDESGQYRAAQTYELTIDGRPRSGVTDGQGVLQVSIAPTARLGKLVIGPDQAAYNFVFGKLQPAGELIGVQQRLHNLGFDCGEITGQLNDATRDALRGFQATCGLEATGEPDTTTCEKLEELHDQVRDLPQSVKAVDDGQGDEIECTPEQIGSQEPGPAGQPGAQQRQ